MPTLRTGGGKPWNSMKSRAGRDVSPRTQYSKCDVTPRENQKRTTHVLVARLGSEEGSGGEMLTKTMGSGRHFGKAAIGESRGAPCRRLEGRRLLDSHSRGPEGAWFVAT